MSDVKIAYAASAAFTFTLASIATSSTRVAGSESTAIDNTSNKYLDYLVAGKVTTGTSPTDAKQIDLWVYASFEDTPTYPDVLDGTNSTETLTSEGVRNGALVLAASISTNNTSDRTYWFAPFSVAALFGGRMPKFFGLFLSHDTGVNLNSTGGNHAFWYTPVYETVA
jgi:hypothetical protein